MKTQTVAGFYVAGFSARTDNSAEATGMGKIPGIWGKFMHSHPGASLENRIGDNVYAVYFDYESDHTGAYTFLLGFKVSSLADLPVGMAGVEIRSGEYAVMTSARGPAQQVVPATWFQAWNNKELEEARSYQVDFELYDQRAANPSDAQVDLYLGIRS